MLIDIFSVFISSVFIEKFFNSAWASATFRLTESWASLLVGLVAEKPILRFAKSGVIETSHFHWTFKVCNWCFSVEE